MAAEVLARHAHDYNRRNLVVTGVGDAHAAPLSCVKSRAAAKHAPKALAICTSRLYCVAAPCRTPLLSRSARQQSHVRHDAAVLEARGLAPRRGVVVALSASELPSPQVVLSLNKYPQYTTPVLEHTLTPRCAAC